MIWNTFVEFIHGWSIESMIARLVIAMAIGMIIGVDREMKNRGAGMKTHVLVCVGSALISLMSEYIMIQFPEANADMNRIGAQVVSGVGFLGVGTIIVTGNNQIRGLTTAAGLWVCACTGLAIGIGYVEGTLIALVIVVFTLKVLDKVDIVVRQRSRRSDMYIEFIDSSGPSQFINWMHKNHFVLRNLNLVKSRTGEAPVATFTIMYSSLKEREKFQEMMHDIPGQTYMDELD